MKKVLFKSAGLLLCGASLCVSARAESVEDVSAETRQAAEAYWEQRQSEQAGRAAGDSRTAVDSYVASTRGLAQGEYSVIQLPDDGRLQVYRVSINETAQERTGGERAFEVFVDGKSATVTAEDYAE